MSTTPLSIARAGGAIGGGGERGKFLQAVHECVQQAGESESWGLLVEAGEELQKAYRKITSAAADSDIHPSFSTEEKELLRRIAQALKQKASSLQNLSSVGEPSSGEHINLKAVCSALQGLQSREAIAEILKTAGLSEALPPPARTRVPLSLQLSDDDYSAVASGKAGSLMQRTAVSPGHTYLTITIDSIGLKDPQNYLDPFITVSVMTPSCHNVEPPQDTPVTSHREGSYILFGVPVELQTPTDRLPKGSAIFFELKHYKPKKAAVSTRCFSFMEMDEIKNGRAILEIYKKPTDFSRRRHSLLSVKPLYLHLSLLLTQT